ncbi:MAG: hypothetical protein AB8G05_11705 [Oligoflexales bacterium]
MDVIVKRSCFLFFSLLIWLSICASPSLSEESVKHRASLADIMETRGIRELYLNDMLRETSEIVNQRLSPTDLTEQINDSVEKWDEYFVP